MFYKLITSDWLRLHRHYDINGKLVSCIFILFGLRIHNGNEIGYSSVHHFCSLYTYTRLKQDTDEEYVFKHIPLLERLLGTLTEHDVSTPKYTRTHRVNCVDYTLNIFERYSYFSKAGKLFTFDKKEVYQVISPIGDCFSDTFAPTSWTERPHPNVIINQAKAIKVLIDNYTLD